MDVDRLEDLMDSAFPLHLLCAGGGGDDGFQEPLLVRIIQNGPALAIFPTAQEGFRGSRDYITDHRVFMLQHYFLTFHHMSQVNM